MKIIIGSILIFILLLIGFGYWFYTNPKKSLRLVHSAHKLQSVFNYRENYEVEEVLAAWFYIVNTAKEKELIDPQVRFLNQLFYAYCSNREENFYEVMKTHNWTEVETIKSLMSEEMRAEADKY